MIEKSIISENGNIYYWLSENWIVDRKTLVFLHGMTANHTMFEKQIEYFSKNYNLITWDAPAHGKSRPYSNFSYPNAAEALKNILKSNQIEAAIMIGQSMGGFMIQSFIKRYPEMVAAFVGIDTTPYGTFYYSKSDKWWLEQIEWMSYLYPIKMMKKAIAKQVSYTQESYENMMSMLEPYSKKELCQLMGIGYAGFLKDNCDLQITCPVLLLLGDNDKTGKVSKYNREWADKTGFPLKIIKNACHNSNYDNPQEVNREIDRFIQGLPER